MEERDVSNADVRSIWNYNAAFWDEKMGEGNQFQRLLVGPATERLLELEAGEQVLDLACGNGVFARRLASLGARVVAGDFSQVFIERAKARTNEHADRIEYRIVDASDREQLLSMGRQRFDAVVCNMALMDIVDVDPLFATLPELLKPYGRFVWSVVHPCFNSVNVTRVVEQDDYDGTLVTRYSVKVWSYATPTTRKGIGIPGQPEPHYYFHRSISTLFNLGFAAGFVLDGLEEPTLPPDAEAARPTSWANFHEIPPVLVARMRLHDS